MEYIIHFWKNALNFKGRARRKELLLGWVSGFVLLLVVNIFTVIVGAIVDNGFVNGVLGFISSVVSLTFSLTCLSCEVRRLHDIGKNWVWVFVSCIPFIGTFYLLYLLLLVDSVNGPNQWGECPKDGGQAQGFGIAFPNPQQLFGGQQQNNFNYTQQQFGGNQQFNQGYDQGNYQQQNAFNGYDQMQNQSFNQQQDFTQQGFNQSQGYQNQNGFNQNFDQNQNMYNQQMGFEQQNYQNQPNQGYGQPMNNFDQSQMFAQQNPNMQNNQYFQ